MKSFEDVVLFGGVIAVLSAFSRALLLEAEAQDG